MKKALLLAPLFALAAALVAAGPACRAQGTDGALYAAQFPGATVADKVTAAMAQCPVGAASPCVIVIDPGLALFNPGTMPAPCSNCYFADWRNGPPWLAGQSLPKITTDASTVPIYGTGLAVINVNAVQESGFDGTSATKISGILAPGPGKVIAPGFTSAQCVAGPNPFAAQFSLGELLGSATVSFPQTVLCDATSNVNTLALSAEGFSVAAPVSAIENQPLYIYSQYDLRMGPIVTETVSAAGSGYAVNDTGQIQSAGSYLAANYTVTGITDSGGIASFTLVNVQDVNVSSNLTTFVTTGGGNGFFRVNVTSVQPGTGSAVIAIYYQVLPVY